MATLVIAHHAPTANTAVLRDALLAGASDDAVVGVDVVSLPAPETTAEHLLTADGLLLLTPANFGYMAGLMKDLFDRTFLDIGGSLAADGSGRPAGGGKLPYGLCVHGRYDTEGAVRSVETIVGALPWVRAAPVLSVLGDVTDADRASAYELGATLAALLSD